MENNCSCSGWTPRQAAVNEESCFQVPCWLPPGADSTSCDGYSSVRQPWPVVPFEGVEEDRAPSASKSHSQAEKRRRDRINAQLATLRKLIPKSDKMDKAALLGNAVEHMKELKRRNLEISKFISIPTDIDEVTVIECSSDQQANSSAGTMFIRALVCCDDRPELLEELNHAMEGLRLRMIEADMTCLGGRIKCTFVLCTNDSNHKNGAGNISTIKQSLKVVLSRIVASSASSKFRIKSKRQRFFFPSHCPQ